jgi:hypothetical protein
VRQPRVGPAEESERAIEPSSLYLLLQHYLELLPGAIKDEQLADGSIAVADRPAVFEAEIPGKLGNCET